MDFPTGTSALTSDFNWNQVNISEYRFALVTVVRFDLFVQVIWKKWEGSA